MEFILLTGGKPYNSDKRWNPQKLGETLLLLLLGRDYTSPRCN
jgi:hypothetical protein